MAAKKKKKGLDPLLKKEVELYQEKDSIITKVIDAVKESTPGKKLRKLLSRFDNTNQELEKVSGDITKKTKKQVKKKVKAKVKTTEPADKKVERVRKAKPGKKKAAAAKNQSAPVAVTKKKSAKKKQSAEEKTDSFIKNIKRKNPGTKNAAKNTKTAAGKPAGSKKPAAKTGGDKKIAVKRKPSAVKPAAQKTGKAPVKKQKTLPDAAAIVSEQPLSNMVPKSTEMNAKNAIAHLQHVGSTEELEKFLDGETRATVNSRATSRRNALLNPDTKK